MSSRALRRTAATLLALTLTTISAAPPAHAALDRDGRRAAGAVARNLPGHGFISLLLRLLAKAGGTMDPNGGKTGGTMDPNG